MTEGNENSYSFWADQASSNYNDIREESTNHNDIGKESANNDDISKESAIHDDISKESAIHDDISKESAINDDISRESAIHDDISKKSANNDDINKESVNDTADESNIEIMGFVSSFYGQGDEITENEENRIVPAEYPPACLEEKGRRKKAKKSHPLFRKSLSFLLKASVFGIVAGASFIGFNSLYYHLNPSARPSASGNGPDGNSPNRTEGTSDYVIPSTIVAQGTSITNTDVSDIVDQAMPSLVSISCTFRTTSSFFGYLYEGTASGSGSGIIVGKNETELLIATNNHVVEDALTTVVTFLDGTEASATIKGTDANADLAIVSVALDDLEDATLDLIQLATLGSSDEVKVGQMVVAIGNALGYGQTTTVGYVSAKEREITVKDSATGKSTSMVALQVDAAINPGNSGGALLNTKGEVIGINSAKLSGTSIEGIGYAIPISNVIDILTELMNREILTEEEQGYLGIEMSRTEITEEISAAYGWPIGVYITNVLENGAGAKYGILAGDIITKINNIQVTTSTQLREAIISYRAGTTVTITLWRMENGNYVEHTLDVVLGSRAD